MLSFQPQSKQPHLWGLGPRHPETSTASDLICLIAWVSWRGNFTCVWQHIACAFLLRGLRFWRSALYTRLFRIVLIYILGNRVITMLRIAKSILCVHGFVGSNSRRSQTHWIYIEPGFFSFQALLCDQEVIVLRLLNMCENFARAWQHYTLFGPDGRKWFDGIENVKNTKLV